MKKRVLALLLAAVMTLTILPQGAFASTNSFEKTDNISQNMINAALANLGKKNADFPGMPHDQWCAYFICWLAQVSGAADRGLLSGTYGASGTTRSVAQYAIRHQTGTFTAYWDTAYNYLVKQCGASSLIRRGSNSTYTPRAGDIVFFHWKGQSPLFANHVGLVYEVSGSTFKYVDGNGVSGTWSTTYVSTHSMSRTSSELSGFLRLNTDGVPSTPSTPNVTFCAPSDPKYTSKFWVTETDVQLVIQINKPYGTHVSRMGVNVYSENGEELLGTYSEATNNVPDSMTTYHTWFQYSTEVKGPALKPGTCYRYKFFGIFDGVEVTSEIYPFWTEGSSYCTVTFDPVSGVFTSGKSQMSVPKDLKVTQIWLPTVVRDGYIFDGWFDAPIGGNQVFDSTIMTGDTTLYAHWSMDMTKWCSVSCDYGDYAPRTTQFERRGAIPNIPDPKWEGYTFLGWFTEPDGGGTRFDTKAPVTNDVQIYAHWKKQGSKEIPRGVFLLDETGLKGVEDIYCSGGLFSAMLSAPKDGYCAGYAFKVYNTGGECLGSYTYDEGFTTSAINYSFCYRLGTLSGSAQTGTIIEYDGFCELTVGTTYMYEFSAVVDGKTYSTPKARFRLSTVRPGSAVKLTLSNRTGLNGVQDIDYSGGMFLAALNNPANKKITQSTFTVYTTGGTRVGGETLTYPNASLGELPQGLPYYLDTIDHSVKTGDVVEYSDFSLTVGTEYLYEFTATIDGVTYSTGRSRFRLIAGEPSEPIALTISSPADPVDPTAMKLGANLSAPIGSKITSYTVNIYQLNSNELIYTSSYDKSGTTTLNPAYLGFTYPGTVSGNKVDYSGFSLELGKTYRFNVSAVVNGNTYTTAMGRFNMPQPSSQTEEVSLNLKDNTGLNGIQEVNYNAGRFDALLSAPKGKNFTHYTFNVYATSGSSLGSISKDTDIVTDGVTDYNTYITLKSPSGAVNNGTVIDYGNFQLTVGKIYFYSFTVIVDGQTYSTPKARFRLSGGSSASTGFTDVKSNSYCAEPVKWAVDNNITQGVGGNKFNPNGNCNRDQIVTFLYRSKGSPAVSITSQFTDMPKNEEFQKAISWAVQEEITLGNGKGKFLPGKGCSRAEAVTFLWRAANCPTPRTTATFSDMPSSSDFRKAISWAAENGITTGSVGNRFDPNKPCSRGEIVTFLYRAKDVK